MPRRVASLLIVLVLIASPMCLAEDGAESPTASPAASVTAELTEEPVSAPTEEPSPEPTEEPIDVPVHGEEPTTVPSGNVGSEATPTAQTQSTEEVGTEPTEGASTEPTEEAGTEPTEEAGTEPTEEAGTEPAVSTEPTGAVEETASTAPTVVPTPNPDDEAWLFLPDLSLVSGLFQDVLDQCEEGSTVYLLSDEVVYAMDYTTELVEHFVIVPDPEVFEADRFTVVLSDEAPEGTTPPDEEHDYLYAWVEEIVQPTSAPPAEPTPEPAELELRVNEEGYVPGAWSNVAPVFTLSGIPEGDARYAYAVIAYDERFIILSGNSFTATDEGEYELRFVILDGIGDVVAKSAKYTLQLDFTPPAYVVATMVGDSYKKYDVYAEDAQSGVAFYSNDGGENWVAPNEAGSARFKGAPGDVIPMGMILAKDVAGNSAAYAADFMLPVKMPSFGGGGGGGGGSGDDSGYSHSPAGETVDLNPYNALDLTLPADPMTELTMGDVLLPLSLRLVDAEGVDIPIEYEATFTAAFAVWEDTLETEEEKENGDKEDAGDAQDEEPDTLILTVTDDPEIKMHYEYAFAFNGIVYRMLQNSGIDYMVFRVGDEMTAFSTAGFTAGTEYTRLKAGGVSTKAFDYEAVLEGDMTSPEEFGLLLSLKVDEEGEEQVYDVSGEEGGEMYYYDVQVGPAEMMDIPFGAWECPVPDAQ